MIRLIPKAAAAEDSCKPSNNCTYIMCWEIVHNSSEEQVAVFHGAEWVLGYFHPEGFLAWGTRLLGAVPEIMQLHQ